MHPILALLACVAPPTAPTMDLTPASPTTTDDLVAVVSPPEDGVTHTLLWFMNGTLQPDLTTDTVPAERTFKAQIWSVEVTPSNKKGVGPSAEASVDVLNSPPATEVTLSPAFPYTSDPLEAVVTATDADDDPLTFHYDWFRDDLAFDDTVSVIPPEYTAPGEIWSVTVTTSDGEANGAAARSSVTIGNRAPTLALLSVGPSPAYRDTVLTAEVQAFDADDDRVLVYYAWSINGTVVQMDDNAVFYGKFVKHDEVGLTVTPYDGLLYGASVVADPIPVLNALPEVGAVLDPAVLYEDTTAGCALTWATDADRDTVVAYYNWYVNDVLASDKMSLSPSSFAVGDVVTCSLLPYDGEAYGEPGVASTTVQPGATP